MVQQQALRDFAQAMAAFFDPANPAGRPSWRKAGRDEGFRIVGRRGRQWDVRRLSRNDRRGLGAEGRVGAVPLVPRGAAGREVLPGDHGPGRALACRLRRDPRCRSRRRATAQVVGIDRGVAVSAALSTGELLHVPGLTARERKSACGAWSASSPAPSAARTAAARVRLAIARLRARETDRRKDWAEKASTDIARRFDLIRVEDLQIRNMTRSAKGTAGEPGPERPRRRPG